MPRRVYISKTYIFKKNYDSIFKADILEAENGEEALLGGMIVKRSSFI